MHIHNGSNGSDFGNIGLLLDPIHRIPQEHVLSTHGRRFRRRLPPKDTDHRATPPPLTATTSTSPGSTSATPSGVPEYIPGLEIVNPWLGFPIAFVAFGILWRAAFWA
jgi:hypothetical protein